MYKTFKNQYGETLIRFTRGDGKITEFCCDPDNTDYQAFLKYQAEGGKVYGADEEVPDGQAAE